MTQTSFPMYIIHLSKRLLDFGLFKNGCIQILWWKRFLECTYPIFIVILWNTFPNFSSYSHNIKSNSKLIYDFFLIIYLYFRYSHGVSSPGRHVRTRLYFTSESHVHSLLTVLRYGGLLDVSLSVTWSSYLMLLENG